MTLLDGVVAFRGLLEMVLWLFVGRGLLALLAGASGNRNGVLSLFDFLLRPVRAVADRLLARIPVCRRDLVSFLMLLILWFGLGLSKFFLAAS
jgi:hypothetical protein